MECQIVLHAVRESMELLKVVQVKRKHAQIVFLVVIKHQSVRIMCLFAFLAKQGKLPVITVVKWIA